MVTPLPRMRTVAQIKAFFKENGEDYIGEREIRRLAKNGQIPSIVVGNRKLLINLDELIKYLNTNTLSSAESLHHGIRRID